VVSNCGSLRKMILVSYCVLLIQMCSESDVLVAASPKNGESRELDGGPNDGTNEVDEGESDIGGSNEEDGPWYMGKAKEEFHKRRRGSLDHARPPGEEEDPIEVRSFRSISK
jgi:hypothetical protein